MIVVIPGFIPQTRPPALTLATAVLLLLHVPPLTASDSKVHDPTHMLGAPVIPGGGALTVNTVLTEQPPAV
jgi:hypothetical protein